jgi:hypothetical protein
MEETKFLNIKDFILNEIYELLLEAYTEAGCSVENTIVKVISDCEYYRITDKETAIKELRKKHYNLNENNAFLFHIPCSYDNFIKSPYVPDNKKTLTYYLKRYTNGIYEAVKKENPEINDMSFPGLYLRDKLFNDFFSNFENYAIIDLLNKQGQTALKEAANEGKNSIETPSLDTGEQPSEDKTDKPHFTITLTENEQKKLFDGLITYGFLHTETNFENFCSVFRTTDYIDNGKPFERLQWVKIPTRNKTYIHKKSVFKLLYLLCT